METQSKSDLYAAINAEFQTLGAKATTFDVAVLTKLLWEQDTEFSDVAIMAACIGYIAGNSNK